MYKTTNSGFTLLEVLIAMAIFTMVGMAANAVLNRVIGINEASKEQFDALVEVQRTFMIMERDFLQATPRAARLNGEMNQVVMMGTKDWADSEADGISFVRSGWDNPQWRLPRSTLQPVTYRLQEQRLERLYGNYVDNVIGFEPKVRVLLEDVEDFTVEYIVSSGDSNIGRTDTASSAVESYQGTTLPRAVKITLLTKEFGELSRTFLMPVSGGDGP